jgi:hypothetical protein
MSESFEAAREQACEKLGFTRSKIIKGKEHEWVLPNQSLLDHDQKKRFSALQLYVQESPDLVRFKDTTDEDGNVFKGAPKIPWRNKKGELLPDYDERLVGVVWGDDKIAAFISDGGNPSDIPLFWAEMNQDIKDRGERDSKSVGRPQHLAAVPPTD